MTSEMRRDRSNDEPTPDPRLERLIRQAVASQNVPLDRQQRHLARIAREGRTRSALNSWTPPKGRQSMFTDSSDPVLPASRWSNERPMLPPIRTRRRQVTELAIGFLGFVLVAALLVALFRQAPEDSLGVADLTSTATPTITTTNAASETAASTVTVPLVATAKAPPAETEATLAPPTPSVTPTTSSAEPTPIVEDTSGYGVLARWDAKVYELAALTAGPDDRVYAVDIERGQVAIYQLDLWQDGSIDLTGGVPLNGERYDLAVDGDGTLYLLDSTAGRVYRYAADGSVIGDWDGSSDVGEEANAGALVNPLAIAVDDRGLVYVTETLLDGRGRIRSFTAEGVEVSAWWNPDAPLPAGLQAIEVVGSTISVLADSSDMPGTILQFDALEGTFIGQVDLFSADNPDVVRRSFAVDAAGNIYVVDPVTVEVVGFSPATGAFLHWTPEEIEGDTERTPNVRVTVDSRGYVYILQSERILMTVLAPPEAIEAARQPTFNVNPRIGTCAEELTANGAYFLASAQVTILASVAGSDELVEVGQATVIEEVGYPAPHFSAPISIDALGVCEGEIDRDGVDITFTVRAEGDPKEANPATVTLFSSSRTPSLTLTPATGDCDTLITATGADFVPETTITLMLGGHSPLPLAHRVAVDENGVFEVELSAGELPGCTSSPDNPLTQEFTIFANTEWPDKREPYPSGQATFTLAAPD